MNRLCPLVLVLAGCVADSGDEGFVVRNNLAPDDDSCAFMATRTAPFVSRGTLSTRSPTPGTAWSPGAKPSNAALLPARRPSASKANTRACRLSTMTKGMPR